MIVLTGVSEPGPPTRAPKRCLHKPWLGSLRNLGSVCGGCQTPLQTSTTGLQGIQDPSPVAAGRDLSTAQCRAGLGQLLLPLFALCRPCSKFKQQFNIMVNTEARQSLGVGLGHPKLRFSVQNSDTSFLGMS